MKIFVLLGALIPALLYAAPEQRTNDPLDRVWKDIIQEQQQEDCVKGEGPLLLTSDLNLCAQRYQFEQRQEQQAVPDFEEKWIIP
jgi:hypothetical protein